MAKATNNHPIDFTELQANEAGKGSGLENMVCRMLSIMGLEASFSGVGSDDGADILAIERIATQIAPHERRWLIECKDKSTSKRSVSKTEIGILDHCGAHNCDAYLLVTTTQPSSGLVKKMEGITDNPEHKIFATFWNREKLIELLYRNEFENVLKEYLPNSYRRVKELDLPQPFKSGISRWGDILDEVIDLVKFEEKGLDLEKDEAYGLALEQLERVDEEAAESIFYSMEDMLLQNEMCDLLCLALRKSHSERRKVFSALKVLEHDLLEFGDLLPYLKFLSSESLLEFFEEAGFNDMVGEEIDSFFNNGDGYEMVSDFGARVVVEEVYVSVNNLELKSDGVLVKGKVVISLSIENGPKSDFRKNNGVVFDLSKDVEFAVWLNDSRDISIESISFSET